MWPWGHLAAGYLCYRVANREAPAAGPASALAVGTQLPDLIDKPLAWSVQVLPNGRSLGHSLLVAVPVLVALVLLVDERRRRVAVALATGYLTHLATDALYPFVHGEWYYLGFLGWPVVPPVEYETGQSFLAHLLAFSVTPRTGFEVLLFVVALAVWYRDGRPGMRAPVESARRVAARARRLLTGWG